MIVNDDRYTWFDTANELRRAAEKSKTPLIGTFELTARCNFACNMCYVRREGSNEVTAGEKSAEEWIALGEQAAKAGTLFLLITGGEPLIRPDFRQIYEALSKMGFIITLYTNGTLVDEEFIRWISRTPPNKVEITLYGASPEVYISVTRNAEAYDKTLKGIDLLVEAGMKIALRTAITRSNVKDIEAMDNIASKRNLTIQHVLNLVKPVRGANSDAENKRLSPLEVKNVNIKELYNDDDCDTVYKAPAKKLTVNNNPMFCSAGKCSYWISWDGKMLPCALMDKPYTEAFASNFEKAWEELKSSIYEITGPEECKHCEYRPYCSVCPAKLQAETGGFDRTSKYICEMAKMIKDKYGSNMEDLV